MKFGAEAETSDAQDDADDGGWELARHFKLHLHPYELRTKDNLETQSVYFALCPRYLIALILCILSSRSQNFHTRWWLNKFMPIFWDM